MIVDDRDDNFDGNKVVATLFWCDTLFCTDVGHQLVCFVGRECAFN